MEILNKADFSYLLQTSLYDLHQESISWISEIEFLETEFNYFTNVLNRYERPGSLPTTGKTLERLNSQLIQIRNEIIGDLGKELKIHEVYLSELLESTPGYDDSSYREKHFSVTIKQKALLLRYRTFKKDLMDFVMKAG